MQTLFCMFSFMCVAIGGRGGSDLVILDLEFDRYAIREREVA